MNDKLFPEKPDAGGQDTGVIEAAAAKTQVMPKADEAEAVKAEEDKAAEAQTESESADGEAKPKWTARKKAIVGIAAVAVAAGLGLGIAWSQGAFDTQQPAAEQKAEKNEEAMKPATKADIEGMVAKLAFDGEDVAAAGEVSVELKDGRAMVSHEVGAIEDAKAAVGLAAKQAAALALGMKGSGIESVTWVVTSGGDIKVAIAVKPDDAPEKGDAGDIIEGSDGWIIADDVYEGMGGEDSGIPQSGGTKPAKPDGDEIAVSGDVSDDSEDNDDADKDDEGNADKGDGGTKPSGNSGGNSGSSGSQGGSSSSGGNSGNSGGGSSASGGNGGGSSPSTPAEPEKPAHSHVYDIPVTEKQWSDGEGYQRITRIICNACREKFGSLDAFYAHSDEMWNQGEDHGGYTDDSYSSWTKAPGYYDVVVGYKCSCGARPQQ